MSSIPNNDTSILQACSLMQQSATYISQRNYEQANSTLTIAISLLQADLMVTDPSSSVDQLMNQSDETKLITSNLLMTCYLLRSKVRLQLQDPTVALADAEEASSQNTIETRILLYKANSLFALGKYEQALIHYHRGTALALQSQHSDIAHEFQHGMDMCKEEIRKDLEADAIRKQVQIDKDSVSSSRSSFWRLSDTKEAKKVFPLLEVQTTDPKSVDPQVRTK
jgi:tetratricopeptide (TPR) repeat protein